jgi:hypothetical protein
LYLEEWNPRPRVLLSSYSSCNVITTKKIKINQRTKIYIKRKLEKKVGQCGGIQGRQDHIEREGETIL